MSEIEKRAIVGEAALEHSDAKRKLAMLESKAGSFANHMRIVAHELSASRLNPPDRSEYSVKDAIAKCPNRDEVENLLGEIATTRSRVNELASSLRAMGVTA